MNCEYADYITLRNLVAKINIFHFYENELRNLVAKINTFHFYENMFKSVAGQKVRL